MSFTLALDDRGKITLRRPDQPDVADVRIRRAFPWTSPSRYVSVRTSDGKELLLIEDLAVLPADQRDLIQKSLERSVFIPRITRVLKVDTNFGYQEWQVQTDRGPAKFRVQEREDIRFHSDGRFSIKDADGNTYEMPPLSTLDAESVAAMQSIV